MAIGANTMLDLISEGANSVTFTTDTAPFEGADALKRILVQAELITSCTLLKGK
jgi:hypothetical protein